MAFYFLSMWFPMIFIKSVQIFTGYLTLLLKRKWPICWTCNLTLWYQANVCCMICSFLYVLLVLEKGMNEIPAILAQGWKGSILKTLHRHLYEAPSSLGFKRDKVSHWGLSPRVPLLCALNCQLCYTCTINPNLPGPFWGYSVSIFCQSHL